MYYSYELAPLFLKDFGNTYSICYMCDFTKMCGFIRFNFKCGFSDIKELLETRYGLTLIRHSYDDLPDIMKHITNKVLHYRNTDKFVVAVVMN
jgi:hypothetical protein